MIWILLIAAFAGCSLAEEETIDYYKVFEEIDPDLILDNDRILQTYLKCFYGEGPCNTHAQLAKESIPDVLATVCGRCSDKQKGIFKYSLNKFVPAHPKDWERILSIYDPTGEAWPKVKAFMES
uniref:Putative chemosensory protein 8 n=2 Tax=Lygus TaxID=30084 RepID=A0A2D0W1V7_LYGLI|nr:putative chemosensory protein 8 [Lygus hesperus]APB88071.1 putative chemosensory protein 8 [Lygus lineolaris]